MTQKQNQIIIDASNAILGRLASYAAKQALQGKWIIIVNCDNAVIAGGKDSILRKYKQVRKRGGTSQRGPFFSKEPFKIVKRTIRGMLPYKKGRGQDSLKKILCYNKTPKEYEQTKKILAGKEKKIKTMPLSLLSKHI